MDLIALVYFILAIAIVGLILYLIETYIPMPEIFRNAIRVIVAIVVILYIVQKFLLPLLR